MYLRYGLTRQHMTAAERLEELAWTGLQTFVSASQDEVFAPVVPPRNVEPCVVPRAGLGASPLGVIRHVRPIVPRPIPVGGDL